jgi:hypothetical protein
MPLREDDQALDLLRFSSAASRPGSRRWAERCVGRIGSGGVRRLPAASACTW